MDLHLERRANIASQRTDRSPDYRPGRRSRVVSEVAEPNPASHSRRRLSVASQRLIEAQHTGQGEDRA